MALRRKETVKVVNRSGERKDFRNSLTGTTGTLIPLLVDEVIPNSDVKLGLALNVQLPPLASDAFMNVDYKVEAFFVPTRLLFKGYERWIQGEKSIEYGAHPNELDNTSTEIHPPVVKISAQGVDDVAPGSLADYLGFSMANSEFGTAENIFISALPFLAYHFIYDEFYRSTLVQKSVFQGDDFIDTRNVYMPYSMKRVIPTTLGAGYETILSAKFNDGVELGELRQRNFPFDYFTSCTPSPQNGNAAGVAFDSQGFFPGNSSGSVSTGLEFLENPSPIELDGFDFAPGGDPTDVSRYSAGGFTIAALRAANSIQQWLERKNLTGNRFPDYLHGIYGGNLSYGVAQRPVYLGSFKLPVITNGVLANSSLSGNDNNPFSTVGSRYGTAQVQGSEYLAKFHTDEHGYLVVLGSLVPEVTYGTGIRRYLKHYITADGYTDLANPMLQNVGPQPVYLSELQDPSWTLDGIFGYQDRFAEFKTIPHQLHGLLRDGQNLESFALQRCFYLAPPELGSEFLQIPKDYLNQVLAVTDANAKFSYWLDSYFKYEVIQPLSSETLPSLQDPAFEHGYNVTVERNGSYL